MGNISLFVSGEYLSNRLDATVIGFFLLVVQHKSYYRSHFVLPAKLYANCARNICLRRDPTNNSLSYWPEMNGFVNIVANEESFLRGSPRSYFNQPRILKCRLSLSLSLSRVFLFVFSFSFSFFPRQLIVGPLLFGEEEETCTSGL